MMGLAILGVIALVYIVLAYMSARQWPVGQVVIVCFLFIGSLAFLVLVAATLKTQGKWRSQYEQAVKDIETQEQLKLKLRQGTAGGEPGEIQLRGEVNRVLLERGRVWRNMKIASVGNGQILLDPSGWSDAGCGPAGSDDSAAAEEAAPEEAPAEEAAAEAPAEDGAAAGDAAAEEGAAGDAAAEAPAEGAAAPAAPPAPAGPANGHGIELNAVVYAFKQAPLGSLPAPMRRVAMMAPKAADLSAGDASESGGEADTETAADDNASEAASADAESAGADSAEVATAEEGGAEAASGEAVASEEPAEGAAGADGCPVPVYFMGEYRVVASPDGNPNALTLEPTIPLSESQIKQLEDPQASWVLYEVMPSDDHDVFYGLSAEQMRALLSPEGAVDEAAYNALLQEYVRDMKAATEQDAPERKWMRVKFTKEESVDVDVEVAGDAGQPLQDSLFDPSGRTLNPELRQGEKTTFREGDEAILDFAAAQELISQGKAEAAGAVYSRRLRDYARLSHAQSAALNQLQLQISMAEQDLNKLDETITAQQQELAFLTERQAKFTADRDGLANELKVLEQYRESVETHLDKLKTELSRLYRTNRQLVSQLTAQ